MTAEPLIRLVAFAAVFVALAIWELAAPRLPHRLARSVRWPGNLGVLVIDTLVVRVLFPTAAVGFAALAQARGWGALADAPWPG